MPATLTAPRIDVDAAGLLLVAEVEAYLRSVTALPAAAGAGRLDLAGLLAAAPVCRFGSTVQPWHAAVPEPTASTADRLLRRRPVAEVTVQQHLRLVSRYLAQHGWLQGALWDATGRVCVLGAQLRVLQAGYSSAAVVHHARIRIGNELGYQGQGQPIEDWNDAATTTRTDVHRLLERAAARSAN
ncbi:DUF6197 family protein [Kitasatospora indigofera]|uniref:DUF6197 family protein n=1 Tax=Kitasatospora indigofera TaxID=67307 RepID=UPI0036A2BF50